MPPGLPHFGRGGTPTSSRSGCQGGRGSWRQTTVISANQEPPATCHKVCSNSVGAGIPQGTRLPQAVGWPSQGWDVSAVLLGTEDAHRRPPQGGPAGLVPLPHTPLGRKCGLEDPTVWRSLLLHTQGCWPQDCPALSGGHVLSPAHRNLPSPTLPPATPRPAEPLGPSTDSLTSHPDTCGPGNPFPAWIPSPHRLLEIQKLQRGCQAPREAEMQ